MQRLEVVNSRFAFNEDPTAEIVGGLEVFWHDNYRDSDYGDVCLNVDPIQGCYDVEETITNMVV